MCWRRVKFAAVSIAIVVASASEVVLIGHALAPVQPVDARKPLRTSAYLRIYDISDLVPEPKSPYREAIPGTSIAYFVRDPPPTQTEINNQLLKLVTDTVSSDSWIINGGAFGHISILKGRLLVVQTAENHMMISNLLQQLREMRFAFIRVYDVHDLLARDPAFSALIQNQLSSNRLRIVGGKLILAGFAAEHESLQKLIERSRKAAH
jgi:hypothetical protein